MKSINYMLIVGIVALLIISSTHLLLNNYSVGITNNGSTYSMRQGPSQQNITALESMHIGVNTYASSGVSSAIQSSECIGGAGTCGGSGVINSNFWFNEKFISGAANTGGTGACSAENYLTPPHWQWGCALNLPPLWPGGPCFPWLYTVSGSATVQTYSNIVGYLGFPETESGGAVESGAQSCKPGNSGSFNFPDLIAAELNGFDVSNPNYCLPSPTGSTITVAGNSYANDPSATYPNFFNWSASKYLYEYGSSPYYYALNPAFYPPSNNQGGQTSPSALPAPSTLIIPAISCGGTFPNNYVNFKFPGKSGIPAIMSLSGYTPSVGLAAYNGVGVSITYVFGNVFWPPFANDYLAAPTAESSILSAFNFALPTLNNATFPAGNKGEQQYLNVGGPFSLSIPSDYFNAGNPPSIGGQSVVIPIVPYETNLSLLSVANLARLNFKNPLENPLITYPINKSVYLALPENAYSVPNLQSAYYPGISSGASSNAYTYDYFRTDGVFPFCGWNSLTNNAAGTPPGTIYKNCTFENPSYVNPVSYIRFWTLGQGYSGFKNVINDQPFAPQYDTADPLNNFTAKELDSYCFYGENFNENTGVYTPPSYSRIIPPLASENYTSAIGKCNGFFNNTNCFSTSYSTYINFNDGIFMNNIECTPNGIVAQNVTDAWISSIYLANGAGNFCGYFLGRKDITKPYANSTVFGQTLGTCPVFNSNNSEVPLVITMKNVGNSEITNPYLVVLFRDTNISQMFTSNQNAGNPSIENQYSGYYNFLKEMQSTNGVIEVRYNGSLQTNMFYYNPQYPLNPVPLQELLSNDPNYLAGPYNNSLLGLWMSVPGQGQLNNGPNVIRTSNTLLVHANSSNSGLPRIAPNGTVTFTVEIPMGVFKQLLGGKYNVSVYFGNMFNVSWSGSLNNVPTTTLFTNSINVEPLPSSDPSALNNSFNNEIIDPKSTSPSPTWQYLVSYSMNLSKAPFGASRIYSDSINFSVSAPNSTQSVLNVTLNPTVTFVNGTRTYRSYGDKATGLQPDFNLSGSSVSCFASQDNIQDFSVFWTTQAVSPPNIRYAVQNFYAPNGSVSNILVKRWLGILFMPYADQAVLNYNNLPIYPTSSISMQIERPIINQSSTNQYADEAIAYFGAGAESQLFGNFSSEYTALGLIPNIAPIAVPSSIYGFSLNVNSLLGDKSVIRIFGTQNIANYSSFVNKQITAVLYLNGQSTGCSLSSLTTTAQTVTISPSSCVASKLLSYTPQQVNQSSLVLTSSTPFTVQMYNNSDMNLSNTSQGGTALAWSNATNPYSSSTAFTASLNMTASASNKGFTLLFGPLQQYGVINNIDFYLYNTNDTPFNCNIINNVGQVRNNGVTAAGHPGEYYAPNGTILCNITAPVQDIRAVLINKTNSGYLGSGDVGLGVSIQNMNNLKGTPSSLFITDNGVPVDSQDLNLSELSTIPSSNPGTPASVKYTPICQNSVVYNGVLNYSGSQNNCNGGLNPNGEYSISFIENTPGQNVLRAVGFEFPSTAQKSGAFIKISPFAIGDAPSTVYNLTLNVPSPNAVPVSFSLPNLGGCNNVRFLGDSPYPYAETPYQVVSSSAGQCTYDFIFNKLNAYNRNSYLIFAGVQPSPASYSSNWMNVSSTLYSDLVTTDAYTATLLGNCKASLGPCLEGFKIGNFGTVGDLLVNNVSASQASVAETVDGSITKCFTVSYSANQQLIWHETGFGGINYNSNNLYQITNPSQSVQSLYCFFNGAPVVTDSVLSEGQALSFNINNNLISNFSYVQPSMSSQLYVPGPKDVGYNGSYSKSYIVSQAVNSYPVTDTYVITQNNACVQNPYQTSTGALIGSGFQGVKLQYSGTGSYCIFGEIPTYTTESGANNYYTGARGETVALNYIPGIYNLTTASGLNETLYGNCELTGNITGQGSVQTVSSEKLYVLTWPQLNVNGSWVKYNPQNPTEAFLATHTAPLMQSAFPSGGVILSLNSNAGSIMSCPVNTTVQNYTTCTAPIAGGVQLMNGSLDGIEGIPNSTIGNSKADYIGGGCLITSQYSCAPTDGALSLESIPAVESGQVSAPSQATAKYQLNANENSGNQIQINTLSFNCNGWYYSGNQSIGLPHTSYTNTTVSCDYGNNGNNCAASYSNTQIGVDTGVLTFSCTVSGSIPNLVSSGITMSSVSTGGVSESNPTGMLSSNFCGNVTDFINENIQSGIAVKWMPYSTTNNAQGYPLAEVGGCLATRDAYNISQPAVTTTFSGPNGMNFKSTYSCPAGYSGTIESCALPANNMPYNESIPPLPTSCLGMKYIKFNTTFISTPVGGDNGSYGQTPLGCNNAPEGYTTPTVTDGCIAYHSGISAKVNASYVLQYDNSSLIGVGLGVINATVPTNVSIPPSGSQAVVKDQYMSGLSVSQYEINNIFTKLYPSNLFLSNIPQAALFKSSVYPFDLLNVLLLQNPYFKIYGIPALANGSIYDYAMNIFTGGTSANCIGGNGNHIDYALYGLGEGQLCSGQSLPQQYLNGIYLSLGALNQGLHALQFYSVSETGNTADPTVNVYDTLGSAYSINANCSNGNSRSFSSQYTGGTWHLNISSDEECNNINNRLYGYIVSCLYQTPGNTTFTIGSQYYLGYNLPTLWNISYTLLVSPKSYNIVPVNVYDVNTTLGTSKLSFYPPTEFIESGLPQSALSTFGWQMKYAGKHFVSHVSQIDALVNGTLLAEPSFLVDNITVSSGSCFTTYSPVPGSGRASAGSIVNIVFNISSVKCITTFAESGLISGARWTVNYAGTQNSSLSPTDIGFFTNVGNYSYSVYAASNSSYDNNGNPTCTTYYSFMPSAGKLEAGSTLNVKANSSTRCITTFTEYNLPAGYTWTVNYGGLKKSTQTSLSGSSTSIVFPILPAGNYPYNISSYANNADINLLRVGNNPDAIVYDPQNQYIYVANGASNSISVISSTSNTVIANITSGVGNNPDAIVYDPQNQYIYVANGASNSISVISGTSVVSVINTDNTTLGITYDPTNGDLYTVNKGKITFEGSCGTGCGYYLTSQTISIISTSSNSIVATLKVYENTKGPKPQGLGAIDYIGAVGYVYFVDLGGGVGVINPSSNSVFAYLAANVINTNTMLYANGKLYTGGPYGLYILNISDRVYSSNNTQSESSQLSQSIIKNISSMSAATGFTFNSKDGYLYAVNSRNCSIDAYNSTDAKLKAIGLPLSLCAGSVAYDSYTGLFYFTLPSAGRVLTLNSYSYGTNYYGNLTDEPPSPTSGTVTAGSTTYVQFSSSAKSTPSYVSFNRTNIPPNTLWSVTYSKYTAKSLKWWYCLIYKGQCVKNISGSTEVYLPTGPNITLAASTPVDGILLQNPGNYIISNYSISQASSLIQSALQTYWGECEFSAPPSQHVYVPNNVGVGQKTNYIAYTPMTSGSNAVTFLDTCNIGFMESSLPANTVWYVTYAGVTQSANDTSGTTLADTALNMTVSDLNPAGSYSFSVATAYPPNSVGSCGSYSPSPSSGSLPISGSPTKIAFTKNSACVTTFIETGLPSGTTWSVTLNPLSTAVTQSSSASSIGFSTTAGTYYQFSTANSNAGGCVYSPNPSAGSIEAGTINSISFSPTSCSLTFSETGDPGEGSNEFWNLTYTNGQGTSGWSSSSASTITLNGLPLGDYQYSVSYIGSECLNPTISPSSGSVNVGPGTSTQNIGFYCYTTFSENNIPSGFSWSVKYLGQTASATAPSSIKVDGFGSTGQYYISNSTNGSSDTQASAGALLYGALASNAYQCSYGDCLEPGTLAPGSSYTFNFYTITTFAVSDNNPYNCEWTPSYDSSQNLNEYGSSEAFWDNQNYGYEIGGNYKWSVSSDGGSPKNCQNNPGTFSSYYFSPTSGTAAAGSTVTLHIGYNP